MAPGMRFMALKSYERALAAFRDAWRGYMDVIHVREIGRSALLLVANKPSFFAMNTCMPEELLQDLLGSD